MEDVMAELDRFVSPSVQANLHDGERAYLSKVFERCGGYPNLQQLWQLMDEPWQALGCDPAHLDERVSAYYNHPVWLLNGLFIEQDPESLAHRQAFTLWAAAKRPSRVADYGGGYGGLSRLLGAALPEAQVEVVEPHPHPAAIALASDTPNVRYVPELTGSYDLLIATDVFEHVPDPIGLAASTAAHLRIGGMYLMANCFAPVIACHLPQHFHLSIGWDQAMRAMGLQPKGKVRYGCAYEHTGELDEQAARRVEALARRVYPWVKPLPKARARAGGALMRVLSAWPAR
jgi:hypothetical protein